MEAIFHFGMGLVSATNDGKGTKTFSVHAAVLNARRSEVSYTSQKNISVVLQTRTAPELLILSPDIVGSQDSSR